MIPGMDEGNEIKERLAKDDAERLLLSIAVLLVTSQVDLEVMLLS